MTDLDSRSPARESSAWPQNAHAEVVFVLER
jgi:hypothetical protein